jgi:hypothetical protein
MSTACKANTRILLEIKEREQQRGFSSFSHERRDSNEEAHELVRFAGRHVWLLEPPFGLSMHANLEAI